MIASVAMTTHMSPDPDTCDVLNCFLLQNGKPALPTKPRRTTLANVRQSNELQGQGGCSATCPAVENISLPLYKGVAYQ
ncbi:hypothetical protein CBOM_07713 [Ceraceosorus bombacis]|uniref:Uncharacterized protein n=1 Tax=Ceraceosorus bombacis TaxID=401625 RepID=A0A0P1BH58_9BASI|nr:hypothetical protein CBOM_07713 [Ceraceosorus bombacis]